MAGKKYLFMSGYGAERTVGQWGTPFLLIMLFAAGRGERHSACPSDHGCLICAGFHGEAQQWGHFDLVPFSI